VGGGIIKSTDGGTTWSSINSGLGGTPNNVPHISALILDQQDPETLFCVRYTDAQMFRTTNGGASWTPVNSGWDAALFHVVVMAADPRNSGTLYAGTQAFDCGYGDACPPDYYDKLAATHGPGLFKTTDGGQNWIRLDIPFNPSSLDFFGLSVVTIDPRTPGTLYVAAGYPSRVFRSTDGGASWNLLSSGWTSSQVTGLVVDGQNPSTLYAATQGGGVFALTFPPQ